MTEIINPYSQMRSAFEPMRFYGRRSEVGSLVVGVNSSYAHSFLVVGFKFIGKTSLWRYLTHEQGAREEFSPLWIRFRPQGLREAAFAYVDFHHFNTGDGLFSMIFNVLAENETVEKHLGQPLERVADTESASDTARYLLDLLTRLKDNVTPVICLDHFDSVVRSLKPEDEETLARVQSIVPLVVMLETFPTELNASLVSPEKSPFFGAMTHYFLGLLGPNEARQLIVEPSEHDAMPFTESDVDFLIRNLGRHPYLLTLGCEWLFDLHKDLPEVVIGIDERMDEQIGEELLEQETIRSVFYAFWRRLQIPERETLYDLANEKINGSTTARDTRSRLRRKALIERDFDRGTDRVFSKLFATFVKREFERPSATGADTLLAEISQVREVLAPLEQKLFDYLYSRDGQVCTFEELYSEFWAGSPNQAALAAAVSRIRAKLRDVLGVNQEYVKSVRGEGYQLTKIPHIQLQDK